MLRNALSLSALGAAVLFVVPGATEASSAAQRSPTASRASSAEVDRTLGLASSRTVRLAIEGLSGGGVRAAFELAGAPAVLDLAPHSVRGAGYRVLEQRADGSLVEVAPEPPRTLRGTVVGSPGSVVAASLLDDGLHARIRLAGGEELWLQPLVGALPGAGFEDHVLFRGDEVLPVGLPCGTDLLAEPRPVPWSGGGGGPVAEGSGVQLAELACDADFEFFSDYGSTGAVQGRIDSVVNTVNLQYEAEVGLSHEITTVIVRTSPSQPYTSTDALTLLDQFMAEWNANQGGVQRDLAQLFTGKAINGGTIGIAYIGVVCNLSFAYSVVESDFNGNFSCATDLTAHEMGHNWNADHCSCTSNTMNPFITCANTFHPSFTIPEITAFRDSRTCLEGGGPGDPPASLHVASIDTGTVNIGQGNKLAQAIVTIVDDQGGAVSGATVMGSFTGDIDENVSAVTNGSGTAVLTTTGSKKGRLRFTFCVEGVSGPLPYVPGDNAETCQDG